MSRDPFMNNRLKAELQTGFTLIEMLVAVTLVLLMMVMFGQIFQVATESVTKQRTMADNDQNTRSIVTMIRADLDKRTSRSMVPFFPGELAANPGTPFQIRKGYFYLNNNNLADRTDDVLQFTVLSTVSLRNSDETQYFGRAEALTNPLGSGSALLNFLQSPNQPDRDDGQVTANEAGASRAAEVSYWMRGGKLYRRVMLIRDPIPAAGVDPAEQSQPKYQNPANGLYFDFFAAAGVYATTPSPVFFRDYDYSAHAVQLSPAVFGANVYKPAFNGMDTLSNDVVPSTTALGQSWNRWGFSNYDNPTVSGALTYGLPREYAAALPPSPAAPPDFLGRFNQEETSSAAFQYPQSAGATPAAITNWMNASNAAPLNADGVVTALADGPRVGVDLLLSHVHEFRVEAWDQRLNDFAAIGHNRTSGGVPGDFHFSRRLNASYGPLVTGVPPFGPNIFDTWHPAYDRNADGVIGSGPDRPPFRPLNYDPSGVSGSNPATTNPSGSGAYWTINTNYQVGDVIFPQPGEDLNFNGYLDPGEDGINGFAADGLLQDRTPGFVTEDLNGNGILDAGEDGTNGFPANGMLDKRSFQIPYFPMGLTFAYRCIRAGASGPTRLNEPNWSSTVGYIQRDPSGNGPDWIVDYNARPLRAIRITVRFEHPTAASKQMKQVTIVHSLRDTTSVP